MMISPLSVAYIGRDWH